MYYTALPSTPRYQICTSATLPTYNFEKSKINFNQCNFVNINIYILKQCSKKSSYDDLKTTMKVNESKYKINPRRRKTFIPCHFKVVKSDQFQISSCCFFLPRKGICGKIQNLIKKTLIASSKSPKRYSVFPKRILPVLLVNVYLYIHLK